MTSQSNLHNSPLETLHVNSKKVSCDGSKGSSGHPLVYLDMGKNDYITCPYCSKYFTIKSRVNPAVTGQKNQK